jgi:hypothetical protein
MQLEVKAVTADHPDAGKPTAVFGAEVVARQANAGESEADAERQIREELEPDSDVLVAYLGREPIGIGALPRAQSEDRGNRTDVCRAGVSGQRDR